MQPTHNLTKLKGAYPEPTTFGLWTPSARLDEMAASIEIAVTQTEIDRLKSIPDPWARPLLFNQALTGGETHIAKADAVKQWRGLLALLALRHFYKTSYILNVRVTDLPPKEKKVEDPGDGSINADLRTVLNLLLPTDSISKKLDWKRTGVITITPVNDEDYNGSLERAIGLMVPNCLVAPARGARNIKLSAVPWLAEGLGDPCALDGIPSEQWQALSKFLAGLLTLQQSKDVDKHAKPIFDEIELFREACQGKLTDTVPADYSPVLKPFENPLPHAFYAALLNSPEPLEVLDSSVCQVRLLEKTGLVGVAGSKGLLAGLILIDPEIARTLGRNAADVRLYKKYMLGTINQGGNRAGLIKEAGDDGYLVITPEQIFTQKLVNCSENKTIQVSAHGKGAWQGFLLPLSPLALLLVERSKLLERLTIEDHGDAYEVQFTVDLAAPGQLTQPHKIRKRYDKQADVVRESIPEDVTLWPQVGMAEWPWNFMRYSHSKFEMSPRFAASARSLAGMVRARSRDERPAALQALNLLGASDGLSFDEGTEIFRGNIGQLRDTDGSLITHRMRFQESQAGTGEEHILGKGGDFLFLGMTGDHGVLPVGCILLPKTDAAFGQQTMEIAVDFGTTNTVVYRKLGAETVRMVFQPRVGRPIAGPVADPDEYLLDCMNFFPAVKVESPFPTVMLHRKFDVPDGWVPKESTFHGMTDNIFFMPEVSNKFGRIVERQRDGHLEFDLKWSPEARKKLMVQRFLRQIVLMSTAEAMAQGVQPGNIEWRFSYPQAWSADHAKNFKSYVKGAWTELMSPVLGDQIKPDDKIEFETEGEAAMRYFVNGPDHRGEAGNLVLMFDIGGGTTEIAVCYNEETVWRSSFRIAGGDFFTRFMANNPEIFDFLRGADPSLKAGLDHLLQARAEGVQNNPDENPIAQLVELYISQSEFNGLFEKSFPSFCDEAVGIGLTNSALVALAGIFHYTGLVVRNLIEQDQLPPNVADDLTLAFAGRGATFFRFLGNADDPDASLGQLAQIILDVIHAPDAAEPIEDAGSVHTATLKSLFSAHPKHEVAHGMLCAKPESAPRRRRTIKTPLGEAITLRQSGTASLGASDAVEAIPAGAELGQVAEVEFARFLKFLEHRTGLGIRLDAPGKPAGRTIKNLVERALNSGLRSRELVQDVSDGETSTLEPPFITKLRALVHIMADSVDSRKEKMLVQKGSPQW